MRGWVQSSSELLRELWWKCTTSAEWKLIYQSCSWSIAARILTCLLNWNYCVNSVVKLFKDSFDYFLWPCWVPTISVLTLAYCCSEGEGVRSILKMMLSSRRTPQSIACEVWSLRFQDKLYNSDSLLFVLILFYVILLLIIHLWCLYMYETWSWHTYSYAFGFVLKTGCDRKAAV